MDYLLHHLLRTSASRIPNKEALVHGAERLTYAEVSRRVSGLAYGLQKAGLDRGDRMGIFLEPSIAQVVSIFAISQAGGAFVPINHLLFPDQVAHIVNDCRMKGLITSKSRLSDIAGLISATPSLEFAVLIDEDQPTGIPIRVHFFQQLSELTPRELQDCNINKDLAAVLYTSGSTGKPKGVMLNHAQLLAGASIVSNYLEITEAERILALLPLSFDAGLNQLTTAFQQGGTLVLMTFVFAKEIVETLLREDITGLAGVPTLWGLLGQPSSTLSKRRFPSLRYITNTGGPMPQTVLAVLRQALPTTKIYLMYGLTEAFRSTYLPPEELDRRPGSIGKAIPNTEILVINDQGQLCQPDEVGELVHRGPTVSLGYWGHPDLTDRVLRPHPFLPPELAHTEKVCYSGDLVRMDKEGFLYFVGRRDGMIKRLGFRVSPTDVEEVIFHTGKVRSVAVIGVPDEIQGQHIKAFVVPGDGTRVDPDSILSFCATKMPRYMVPGSLEIVDDLPKTSSGKIDYAALRRREGF